MPLRFSVTKTCVYCFVLLSITGVSITGFAQSTGRQQRSISVQENFSAEEEGVKKPVPLPVDVLKILAQDERVRRQMEKEDPKPAEVPGSWFSASEIRLGPSKESDLIVQATGPLVGANIVVFWVFIRAGDRWKMALMVPAHDLRVMRKHNDEYRNIEASGETCCTITMGRFRFDGSHYQKYFEKTEDIK